MLTAYELGCWTAKQAAELPWRERVEVYAKHPRTGKIYGGMWNADKSFAVPGGGVDSGETPEQAAIRELAEETGIHATNPVRLPIDPVDNPWSDAYRAEKGRNFAGSRTHFVLADYLKKDKDKQLDKWEANNRKFYAPEQALALMQGKQFLAPDVAAARVKAIQHILQSMQKKAAINTESSWNLPILVSGHSGAGKSTLAKKLSERTGLPLVALDDDPEFKAFLKNDPNNKHLIAGSPENTALHQLRKDIAQRTFAELQGPAVVEGTQLAALPSSALKQYLNRVYVQTPKKQLLAQRLERVKEKLIAKGKPWDDAIAEQRDQIARNIYDRYAASMRRYSQLPGTLVQSNREPIEKLLDALRTKQAALNDEVKLQEHPLLKTDPDMLEMLVSTPKVKTLYHVSPKQLTELNPAYNTKKYFGYEYGVPVVFAGDALSSAFAAAPTEEYLNLKNKLQKSIYHRLVDEKSGRKVLLGHNPGGYAHELDPKDFYRVERTDREVGKPTKSIEYVATKKVKPLKSYPIKMTDYDALPEYEFIGDNYVGEIPASDYLAKAKNPKVITAINNWLQKNASHTVTYCVNNSIADLAKQAALNDEVKLQEHQQRIIDRMNAGDKKLLLYHGLGSGKSLSSLAAAEAAGGDYTAVTPASLRQNYEKEIEKFTEGSNPEVMSYTGIGAGKSPTNVPNTVIFDEAHRLRNPNTASARAARNLAGQAKNLLVLTGTPITNEPSDLASLLGLLHGKNITPQQFDEQFVGHKKVYPSLLARIMNRNPGEEVYVKNEDKLKELLKGKIDYQPSKTPEGVNVKEETVKVPLSASQERIQSAIKSQIPPEWAWKLNKEFPLSRDELKSLNSFLTGLRQSSLSTLPFRGDKDPLSAFKQSGKLQKAYQDLQQELEADPRKKAIIYSNYIGAGIDPYAAALKANNVPYGVFHGGIPLKQRKQTLQDYNEGKLRALLLGPAAAEGISTKGTNLIQLLDPHWHESRLNQARGRGLRFDSHTGLPEDLKNVAVKRYISESKEPSLLGWLMGYKRQRTGDEILQSLAANKEKANELFRNILKEEGSPPKKASDDTMEKILQDLLANCTDLALLFKHCHWNAIGKMFKPLHDFLDEVHGTLVETSDDIAERMVALDYPASGLISQIAAQSAMSALPLKFLTAETIVDELTTRLSKLTAMFNKAIKDTESDPVTSNMLQDMTHELEKHLWMLRRQKGNSVETQKVAAARALNQLFS